jgi:hypothetical protein
MHFELLTTASEGHSMVGKANAATKSSKKKILLNFNMNLLLT